MITSLAQCYFGNIILSFRTFIIVFFIFFIYTFYIFWSFIFWLRFFLNVLMYYISECFTCHLIINDCKKTTHYNTYIVQQSRTLMSLKQDNHQNSHLSSLAPGNKFWLIVLLNDTLLTRFSLNCFENNKLIFKGAETIISAIYQISELVFFRHRIDICGFIILCISFL